VLSGAVSNRDEFFQWIWGEFGSDGLLGVHEGTLLSEHAFIQGLETESWTVDSAEAPRERDWVGQSMDCRAELYFSTQSQAENASAVLRGVPQIQVFGLEVQQPQDWDAQWKASFQGVAVPPCWQILPPWISQGVSPDPFQAAYAATNRPVLLRMNPGAGFGTGTHETTQLCLEAIGRFSGLKLGQVLDFGSGSGILSIALALLGAQVDAVEIDPLAMSNAQENAKLNPVEGAITWMAALPESSVGPGSSPPKQYSVIVANILRPVLVEYAEQLMARLQPGGQFILSGLIESDVPVVLEKYARFSRAGSVTVQAKGEWRAIILSGRLGHSGRLADPSANPLDPAP
jgi:ribosomal protein L11 methyltransferase